MLLQIALGAVLAVTEVFRFDPGWISIVVMVPDGRPLGAML
jgi:hypothetical protein